MIEGRGRSSTLTEFEKGLSVTVKGGNTGTENPDRGREGILPKLYSILLHSSYRFERKGVMEIS